MTTEAVTKLKVPCVWDPHLRGDIRGLVLFDPQDSTWRSIDGNLMVVEVELTHGGRLLLPYHCDGITPDGHVWARSDRKVHTDLHEALRTAHEAWDKRWA